MAPGSFTRDSDFQLFNEVVLFVDKKAKFRIDCEKGLIEVSHKARQSGVKIRAPWL